MLLALVDFKFTVKVYSSVVSVAPTSSLTGNAFAKLALSPSINENSISPDVIVVVVFPVLE